jgi:hypothetical protein
MVAAAGATLQERTATLRVVLGAEPDWNGLCIGAAFSGSVLIRLPAPAPPGTTFVSAPCGPPRDPLPCG